MIYKEYARKKDKAMLRHFNDYRHSQNYRLDDCYIKSSHAKEYAFIKCDKIRRENNGIVGKIVSFNSQIFTYGFIGLNDEQETFVYITPYHTYWCYLSDLYE